jgi:serine kinase of HPr protein (carbohydrate metabolism regulator)
MSETASIHASAVLVGPKAILIRGPSGSGKSRLAWELVTAPPKRLFARLVADDRAYLGNHSGSLLVRPVSALAGLIEIHGFGIRRIEFEPVAVVGLIVDLGAADGGRHPEEPAKTITIEGVTLPRLPVASAVAALPLVMAAWPVPLAEN